MPQAFSNEFQRWFWEQVEMTPGSCWTGELSENNGHGELTDPRSGDKIGAHRMAWILLFGPITPADGPERAIICHLCDMPICVSPAHLYKGTYKTNAADREAKGAVTATTSEELGRRESADRTEWVAWCVDPARKPHVNH